MERGRVVSIGTFDGVHLGHQAILRELASQAHARELPSLVYAFAVPPRWVMRSDEERYLLLPPSEKLALLRGAVDAVHSEAFETVRAMDPDEFVETILIGQLKAQVVVEGESFRFGRDRAGDLETLTRIGERRGVEVIGVPPILLDGEAVSSTRIRDALLSGDVATARRCLGRPPILMGRVTRGDRLGGTIGFPTANLQIDPHILLPRPGAYLVHADSETVRSYGVLYVGSRPTLRSTDVRCEVHLLDFPARALYGEPLEIRLLDYVREDRTFPSLEALRAQIELDVRQARRMVPGSGPKEDRIAG